MSGCRHLTCLRAEERLASSSLRYARRTQGHKWTCGFPDRIGKIRMRSQALGLLCRCGYGMTICHAPGEACEERGSLQKESEASAEERLFFTRVSGVPLRSAI